MYGVNTRMGWVQNIDKFDGSYFGFLGKQGSSIDPESRILLETTYEAIADAGQSNNKLFSKQFYNVIILKVSIHRICVVH